MEVIVSSTVTEHLAEAVGDLNGTERQVVLALLDLQREEVKRALRVPHRTQSLLEVNSPKEKERSEPVTVEETQSVDLT